MHCRRGLAAFQAGTPPPCTLPPHTRTPPWQGKDADEKFAFFLQTLGPALEDLEALRPEWEQVRPAPHPASRSTRAQGSQWSPTQAPGMPRPGIRGSTGGLVIAGAGRQRRL